MCFVTISFVKALKNRSILMYLTFKKHLVAFQSSGQTNTEWC